MNKHMNTFTCGYCYQGVHIKWFTEHLMRDEFEIMMSKEWAMTRAKAIEEYERWKQ